MNVGYYNLGDEGMVLEITDDHCAVWCPRCGLPLTRCLCKGEEVNPFG